MAVEAKRGCGYRKVNGLYLVGEKGGIGCCKMPILLKTCPCCGHGVKQSRGWTWIDPKEWLKGECSAGDTSRIICPAADPARFGEKVGLLWVGAAFYKTPGAFISECETLGVSRRIKAVPRGFKVGEHWVFLAHPKVGTEVDPITGDVKDIPGIFKIFRPTRIEKIITESMAKDEEAMKRLEAQGVTPVIVPDNDKDHQGSVYDKEEEPVASQGDMFT
jgi:hypothetical protein